MRLTRKLFSLTLSVMFTVTLATACADQQGSIESGQPGGVTLDGAAPEPISQIAPEGACERLAQLPGLVDAAAALLGVPAASLSTITCTVHPAVPNAVQSGYAVQWEIPSERSLIIGYDHITDPKAYIGTEEAYRSDFASLGPVGPGNAYFREFTNSLAVDLNLNQLDVAAFIPPAWLVGVSVLYFNAQPEPRAQENLVAILDILI